MGVGVEEVVGGRGRITTWSLRLSQGCKCGKYPPMCHSAILQHWGSPFLLYAKNDFLCSAEWCENIC